MNGMKDVLEFKECPVSQDEWYERCPRVQGMSGVPG
jgi:hypothetical protein